jgi:propanol-preferring alcohol dehydrogenase
MHIGLVLSWLLRPLATRKMRAAVVPRGEFGLDKLQWRSDVDIPTVSPEGVLVKVLASGCCHTDLHAIEGDWPYKPALPLIPGHEGCGVVIEVSGPFTPLFVSSALCLVPCALCLVPCALCLLSNTNVDHHSI